MKWNILVVDDDPEMAATVKEQISGNKVVPQPGKIECTVLTSFDEAIERMETSRYDLIILDLKDDAADEGADANQLLSGERVISALRKSYFTPVVFHTGFAHKVEGLKSPFVRVVTKGDHPAVLRGEISRILATQLPELVRYIEEQQRSYLWDHIEQHWSEDAKICEDGDLAHLVAKRLSHALSAQSIARFFNEEDKQEAVRPVEMYIWPPLGTTSGFGDVVRRIGSDIYFLVLTPICDCVQGKAEKALLVACGGLEAQREYVAVKADKENNIPISATKQKELLALIRDRRQGKGVQPERFKFLPGTSFLPDLVVDLQQLSQIPFEELNDSTKYARITTLDNPFSEAVQNRFTQYYGRVGTPDLHADLVYGRLVG